MKRQALYLLPTFIAIAVVFNACSGKSDAKTPASKEPQASQPDMVDLSNEQFKTVNIQFGSVEEKSLSGVIRVSGQIEAPPQQLITVSTPYGGTIKKTNLLEGTNVNRGAVIATIENPEFIQLQQDYLDYKSQMNYLKEELDRQQELSNENVNAKKTLQKATSDYHSMVAKVQGLTSKLKLINISAEAVKPSKISSYTNIYAPATGFVTKVMVNVGKFVNPNEPLFEIADTRELHVEIMVFEKDLPRLKTGQRVRFVLNNETKERIAEISLIGREIAADRTVRVHCKLLKEDRELLPGMYLKAVIETGAATTTALPDQALVQAAGKYYIFISAPLAQDTIPQSKPKASDVPAEKHIVFKRVEVGTGVSENGSTEVMLPKGFNKQSKIVISGAYDLLSKMNNTEEEE